MKELNHSDKLHLEAAEGWLGLGNPAEARSELEQMPPATRAHPAVLEVSWQIHAQNRSWEAALETASALIQSVPELPLGWVHRSYALHELKRTQEARDNLLRVVEQFPDDALMRYNLACYECQLGRLGPAAAWLRKAFDVGEKARLKDMALEDSDLKPMWAAIKAL